MLVFLSFLSYRLGVEVRIWSLITQKRTENFALNVDLDERQSNTYLHNNVNTTAAAALYGNSNFVSNNSYANNTTGLNNNNYNNVNNNNNNNNNNNSVALNHKNTRSCLRRNSSKRCDSEYDSCSE